MPVISTKRIESVFRITVTSVPVSAAIVLTFGFSSVSFAQQEQSARLDDEVVEKKVIHEPIHRVPRVADNRNVIPLKVATPSSGTEVPSTNEPEANREPATAVAENNKRNVIPSKLPSATRKIEPGSESTTPATPSSSRTVLPHPLNEALEMAHRGLLNMRSNVQDYSAILVKRERVDGKLLSPEYMQMKIRSERVDETGSRIPFSIYGKFIKPRACAGREVIWVKGCNGNKLCAHEGSGLLSLKTVNLDPDGWIAMQNNRYPIYEAGMENLIVKLIEKAERDRAAGDCEVNYLDKKLNGRACTLIEVRHPEKRAPYDFHLARVFIDKELKLPVRYQAFLWPSSPGAKPPLLEEYTYLNVKLNQGFTDEDFSPRNKSYRFR